MVILFSPSRFLLSLLSRNPPPAEGRAGSLQVSPTAPETRLVVPLSTVLCVCVSVRADLDTLSVKLVVDE